MENARSLLRITAKFGSAKLSFDGGVDRTRGKRRLVAVDNQRTRSRSDGVGPLNQAGAHAGAQPFLGESGNIPSLRLRVLSFATA